MFWGVAVRMPGKGLRDGGGGADGRALSLCMACQPGRWMVGYLPANASARVDGSLPPTPMGGVRFYPGLRRDLPLPRLSLAEALARARML
jgi:hypothetical protein